MTRSNIIDYAIWPILTGVTLFIAIYMNMTGYSLLVSGLAALIFVRIAVIALEHVYPLHGNVSLFRDRYTVGDILYFIVGTVTGRYAALIAAYMLTRYCGAGYTGIWPNQWPLLAQIVFFQFIYAFFQYWEHWLTHRLPAYWRFHSIHHSPRHLHNFKKDRHHFLMVVNFYILCVVPMMLLGAPAELFLWATIWEGINSTAKHSNVRMKVPHWIALFVQSAELHHLHHSLDMRQGNSNFSTMAIWDVIFGTFTPAHAVHAGYGIPGDSVPHAFIESNLFPFSRQASRAFGTGEEDKQADTPPLKLSS